MASTLNVVLAAAAAALFWTLLGLAVSRRLFARSLALPLAPALGWAMHSAAVLPLFSLIGFSRPLVAIVTALIAVVAIAALASGRTEPDDGAPRVPAMAYALAALLAFGVAAAVLPKISDGGVALGLPIFDHSKVAMIDEMVRNGVPPVNPFYSGFGATDRLSYYYLWHFSAAELALLLGISGWEADAALTLFTGFSSLTLMMGLAVWLGGQPATAYTTLALAATASFRPLLTFLFGAERMNESLQWASGFGGWLTQSTWAPQHQAAATVAVLAMLLLARLAQRISALLVVALVLCVVAAFESSAWVGGIAFPLAAAIAGLALLIRTPPQRRWRFIAAAMAAAVLALLVAMPFLIDQAGSTASRGGDLPIALRPYSVFADSIAQPLRTALDLPGYWLVLLPLEFPAFGIAGLIGIVGALAQRDAEPERRAALVALAAIAAASLLAPWLLASIIGDNNDLGWRAVLPAVIVLIAFAAAAMTRWIAVRKRLATALAITGLLLGLPQGAYFLYENSVVPPPPQARAFAQTPRLWEAVRRHTSPTDRIASNPMLMQEMTGWPVNISWALLADRRSCFAGADLTLPFVPVPLAMRDGLVKQFERVFDGKADAGDIEALATQHACRVAVVTPIDGAWVRDPFAASALYRRIEDAPGWRIYRAVKP